MQNDVKIDEYRPEYQEGVLHVIDDVLKRLEIIPQSEQIIDDEDLYKIPEVYGGRGHFWVAIHNGDVIGTVAIRELDNDTAKLNRMFVLCDYHGQGVGQKLLNTALEYARSKEYKTVTLNTDLRMKRAHRFYEKNGFVKTGEDSEKLHYRMELSDWL